MPRSDSTPPPTPAECHAYWSPRVRGAVTAIAGMLAYAALATAFGTDVGFGAALVGLAGSLLMMVIVWKLEARRAAVHHGRPAATTAGPGTT